MQVSVWLISPLRATSTSSFRSVEKAISQVPLELKLPAGSTIIATPAGTDKLVEFITYTATTTGAIATAAALPAQFATSIGYATTTGACAINMNGFK